MRACTVTGIVAAALCAALVSGLPAAAQAQSVRGAARIIDGDTLAIGETRVRLFGIDAPEMGQACFDNGAPVACGAMAKDGLEGLIGGADLTCVQRDIDIYGRMVATCTVAGIDVGSAMVEAGWATAYRRYSEAYVVPELRAQAAQAGIWRWDFERPDAYRRAKSADTGPGTGSNTGRTQTARPTRINQSTQRWEEGGRCLIKGNHSRRGEWIYHLPGMPYYAATRAEDYFCTEQAALAAGYRRAIVR